MWRQDIRVGSGKQKYNFVSHNFILEMIHANIIIIDKLYYSANVTEYHKVQS